MTLQSCIECKHQKSYQNGFVLCGYYKLVEQMVTDIRGDKIFVIGCPKE